MNHEQNPYQEMLDLLRDFQAEQLDRNRAFIDGLPPHVRARVPDDAMTFLEHGYSFAYADAIAYLRRLVDAEKQKQSRVDWSGITILPETGVIFKEPKVGPIDIWKFKRSK